MFLSTPYSISCALLICNNANWIHVYISRSICVSYPLESRSKTDEQTIIYLLLDYRTIDQWNCGIRRVAKSSRERVIITNLIAPDYAFDRRRNVIRDRYDLITHELSIHARAEWWIIHILRAREFCRGGRSISRPSRNRFSSSRVRNAKCFLTRHFDRKWPGRKDGMERGLRVSGTARRSFQRGHRARRAMIHRRILRWSWSRREHARETPTGKSTKHFHLPGLVQPEGIGRVAEIKHG